MARTLAETPPPGSLPPAGPTEGWSDGKVTEVPHIQFRCVALQAFSRPKPRKVKPGGMGSENARYSPLAMGVLSHGKGRILVFLSQKKIPLWDFLLGEKNIFPFPALLLLLQEPRWEREIALPLNRQLGGSVQNSYGCF